MGKFLLILLYGVLSLEAFAQIAPKREMRGAWIATYANIDWPNRTQPPVLQRAALLSILDHHQATGINTLYIQIRSQCDAMYPSPFEPWSADLTGTQGNPPTETTFLYPPSSSVWDPLQFMIAECRKRGIEFHAWINPYRAVANANQLGSFASTHVAKVHPEWLLSQGNLRILNPGLIAARAYITQVIVDIASRYDLDGIHFDDYFYPPPPPSGTAPFNDDEAFANDPRGFTNRADWRRDNVNQFIKTIHDTLKSIKPWVKFGVSPSGIYRNSTNPAIGSATSGMEHYTSLFADSRKWLQEGWVDYIAPQVYWYIGQPGANYGVLIPWWNNNSYGRHIYIGMAGYKVNDPLQGPNWANPSQIPNEIRLNRSPVHSNIYGQSIYNTSSLRSATRLGFRDSLRLRFYQKPALLPTMPWRDSLLPEVPLSLTGTQYDGDSVILNWVKPSEAFNEFDKIKQFVIYRSLTPAIDVSKAENMVAITTTDVTTFTDRLLDEDTTYFYTVTSLDRFHNESVPSNITDYRAPSLVCPVGQELVLSDSCTMTLPDYLTLVIVQDDVSPVEAMVLEQNPPPGTLVYGFDTPLINITATDASGKSSTCAIPVTVKDVTAPIIINPPADLLAETNADSTGCSMRMYWDEPYAIDQCSDTLAFANRSHAPGSVFEVGSTTVTYRFQDEAGNEANHSFVVTVVDTTDPVVSAKNIAKTLVDGLVTLSPYEVDNGSWDNCGIDTASFQVQPKQFTCADIGENVVTLTVKDIHGNQHSATSVVTLIGEVPKPIIELSRTDNTYTGLADNTLALGYGAQQTTLTVTGAAPLGTTYQWNPTTGLSSISASQTTFSPTADGTFPIQVEVTNEYGCMAEAGVVVNVIDVRCGFRNRKVALCLQTRFRDVDLCIPPVAVYALLQAGALLNECGNDIMPGIEPGPVAETAFLFSAYPNPFNSEVRLQFQLPSADNNVALDIYDAYGQRVARLYRGVANEGEEYSFILNTEQLPGKFFIARLVTAKQVYHIRLVKKE